jgi:hypothetical protein
MQIRDQELVVQTRTHRPTADEVRWNLIARMQGGRCRR